MSVNLGNFSQIYSYNAISPIKVSAKNYQQKLSFGSTQDTYQNNMPERFMSESAIAKLARSNPQIGYILLLNGIPNKINKEAINQDFIAHCKNTRDIAVGIYENLPYSIQSGIDINTLKEAAYLHDIGKVYIPQEILGKNGELSNDEIKIMQLHPVLSYELLKNENLSPNTLYLIRNHHQNLLNTGYPKIPGKFKVKPETQVLALADEYSALTEKRAYKDSLTREEALTILEAEVNAGKFDPKIFKALVYYTYKENFIPTKGQSKLTTKPL